MLCVFVLFAIAVVDSLAETTCPDGPDEWLNYEDKCYSKIAFTVNSYDDATEACGHIGAYLPIIDDKAENEALLFATKEVLKSSNFGGVYLGGKFNPVSKDVTWYDGSKAEFIPDGSFTNSGSTDMCVVLTPNKFWKTRTCEDAHTHFHFICVLNDNEPESTQPIAATTNDLDNEQGSTQITTAMNEHYTKGKGWLHYLLTRESLMEMSFKKSRRFFILYILFLSWDFFTGFTIVSADYLHRWEVIDATTASETSDYVLDTKLCNKIYAGNSDKVLQLLIQLDTTR